MIEKDFLHSLPNNPGVYIMKDKTGKIIYVGKAKNLKNRVNQYFISNSNHTPKVSAMVQKIENIEYILTNSETEALNLECSLIKKNRPKYNILLKDDKQYPYIKITNEKFPRVMFARRQDKDGAKYFGPYVSAFAVKQTLDILHKLFKFRQCNILTERNKPCLNYHIKRCDAPCMGYITEYDYFQRIDELSNILNGKANDFLDLLKEKMQLASDELNFEQAAEYRDKIDALNRILEKQMTVSTNDENEDILYLYKENDKICIQMLYVRAGKLTDKKAFFMNNTQSETDSEVMRAFILQYYDEFEIPKKIYVSVDLEDDAELENYLSLKRGNKVFISTPKRGNKVRFVEMAKKNAMESMRLRYRKQDSTKEKQEAVKQLSYYLGLDFIPHRIEAFDISHTSGSEVVASMVVFEDGMPSKQNYRKFKMKTSTTNDDYGAMKEVLERRFKYIAKEKSDKFKENPDLIFVDGGLGQVNVALEVAKSFDVKTPIFGIFKDDKHKTKGIIGHDKTYEIPVGTKCFSLITEIQDEMHRVAITYHRLLRAKKNTESEILKIEGIGKNRYKSLIEHFKTLTALKKASVEQIAKVKGISPALARKIHDEIKNSKL
ncbi:MAG: excinuclease ABC subunit UvrC [Clostridia bacterium]|nr:excinuclease ABC subunit UvrC [Clostridia bacterium]